MAYEKLDLKTEKPVLSWANHELSDRAVPGFARSRIANGTERCFTAFCLQARFFNARCSLR